MSTQQVQQDSIPRKQSIDSQTRNKAAAKNVTFTGVSPSKYQINQSNRYCTQDSLSDGQIVQIEGEEQSNIEQQLHKTHNCKVNSPSANHCHTVIPRIKLENIKHRITYQQETDNVYNRYQSAMQQMHQRNKQIQVLKQANQRLSTLIKQNNRKMYKETKQESEARKIGGRGKNKGCTFGQDREDLQYDSSEESGSQQQSKQSKKKSNKVNGKQYMEDRKRATKAGNQNEWHLSMEYKDVYMGIICGIICYLLVRIIGIAH